VTALKVGVIGVGYLGRFHAQKYLAIAGVELVGVCDVRAATGRAVARECGVEFFGDARDLLGRVDAVTIATTTAAHFGLAKTFLEHGVHVLVEKPMTTSSAEGRELTALAERAGLTLQVGHVERFNPALLAALDKLGAARFIECHRLTPFRARGADVNVVLDLMIHDLDVILSLIAGSVVSVSAVGIPVLTNDIDIANARIEFDTGAIANVTASRVSMSAQRKFRVFQRNQYLSIDFDKGNVQLVTHQAASDEREASLDEQNWSLEKGDALLAEVTAFVESVRDHLPCRVGGSDGVAALELAESIVAEIERRDF
jgi:predicted dehydrogenase